MYMNVLWVCFGSGLCVRQVALKGCEAERYMYVSVVCVHIYCMYIKIYIHIYIYIYGTPPQDP